MPIIDRCERYSVDLDEINFHDWNRSMDCYRAITLYQYIIQRNVFSSRTYIVLFNFVVFRNFHFLQNRLLLYDVPYPIQSFNR